MTDKINYGSSLGKDLTAGVVVFLVALPLCLGIALASGAPLFSGLLAGIIGGVVVGSISGSHTSVSGPAAGLAAIVLAQIAALGSFEAFLLAVFDRRRDPDRDGCRPRRGALGVLSHQRHQGPAGRDRHPADPETDSARVRPRQRS